MASYQLRQAIEGEIPGEFISRDAAGLPSDPGGAPRSPDEVEAMTLHITTGDNLGRKDTGQWWRNIYEFHTGSQGWADIGYAMGVDRYGNVLEGRGLQRQLAHAKGYNRVWLGVAYLGAVANEFTNKAQAAILGLRNVLLDQGIQVEEVNGHRDVSPKACPGDPVYEWIQQGLPLPRSLPDLKPRETDQVSDNHYVVAVIAENEIDEGMARVLGKAYNWKFIHAKDLGRASIGTAVRVGAIRDLDMDVWDETHDVGGPTRDHTAEAVAQRIRTRNGDSRSVT
jgi:hypothetical protein